MKKITFVILGVIVSLGFALNVNAKSTYVINNTEDGTVLKCTATKTSGSINEYDGTIIDYYTFRNGKIYGKNLTDMYKDGKYEPRKMLLQKISDDEIRFKDRLYSFKAANYKWVTIDRKTGKYDFRARRQYNGYCYLIKRTFATGNCSIVKDF